MLINETAVEIECRKNGLDIVSHPLYRIIEVCYLILSLAAVPLLLNVQINYIFGSTFHRNIKIILQMYYSSALLHAVMFSIAKVYQVSRLFVSKACDFFPPTYIYAFVSLSIALSYSQLINSLLAMCCERVVATIRSSKYENNGIALGVLFVVLTIVGDFIAVWYAFDMDDFEVTIYTMIAVPPGAVRRFNNLSMVHIAISFVCMIAFYVSSRISKRESSVIFFILSAAGGIVIRELGSQIFHSNNYLQICFREMCYLLPIFTFVLPIYSVRQFKRYRLRREKIIRSIMTMESRGVSGLRNYEEVIARAWQDNRQP